MNVKISFEDGFTLKIGNFVKQGIPARNHFVEEEATYKGGAK